MVFALLALEELGSAAGQAVAVITVTVLLSVVAPAPPADPLATRYAKLVIGTRGEGDRVPAPDVRCGPRAHPRRTASR